MRMDKHTRLIIHNQILMMEALAMLCFAQGDGSTADRMRHEAQLMRAYLEANPPNQEED